MSCNREGCSNRASHCFLMRGEDDKFGNFNWRLDLCPEHADAFRLAPDEQYEGIESEIDYTGPTIRAGFCEDRDAILKEVVS